MLYCLLWTCICLTCGQYLAYTNSRVNVLSTRARKISVSLNYRSSHQRSSIKKAVLKNSAIFTGKHLCWSHYFIKKRLQNNYFPVNIAKFLRTSANGCFLNSLNLYYSLPAGTFSFCGANLNMESEKISLYHYTSRTCAEAIQRSKTIVSSTGDRAHLVKAFILRIWVPKILQGQKFPETTIGTPTPKGNLNIALLWPCQEIELSNVVLEEEGEYSYIKVTWIWRMKVITRKSKDAFSMTKVQVSRIAL